MDFRSNAPLERPQAAEQQDHTDTADSRAPCARPRRPANGLRVKRYDAARDYPLIASWWAARDNVCLPADVLPPTACLTVNGRGTPVAACFIWLTNAKAAYLAFPVSAPELAAHTAYRAVGLAIDGALEIAREAGCQMIWAATSSRSIDRLYDRAGLTRSSPHSNFFMLMGSGMSSDMLTEESNGGGVASSR
jgi:hypothetical protein